MAQIRLQDVADHAGVSLKTVSNVVNEYPHVRPQMRARVEASIKALGYRPNLMARRLATGRSNTIAIAISDISIPYYAELARKIYAEAQRRGFSTVLLQTGNSLSGEREVLDRQNTGLFDGLIFNPDKISPTELAKKTAGHACVVLGESPAPPTVDHVFIDNFAAAKDITNHLLSQGRRNLLFLGYEASGITTTSMLRLRGFRRALEDAGLTADPNRELSLGDARVESAYNAVMRALDEGVEVDGIVGRDDLPALGAARAILDGGLRIPQDVALTGWDDISVARFGAIPLTTVRPDTDEIARTSVDRVISRMDGLSDPGEEISAGYELVIRGSSEI